MPFPPFSIHRHMQPDINARRAYTDLVEDVPTIVRIPRTRRSVKLRGIKPYTIERLTRLWQERELYSEMPKTSGNVLKSMAIEPYFTIKEAVLMTLNSYWSIRILYPFKWRIWAFFRQYDEKQMLPIIQAGKKKLPLMAHWSNMAFSVDMRNDWMKMTSKEAEQYQAELLSAAKLHSQRSSQSTEGQDDSSSDS